MVKGETMYLSNLPPGVTNNMIPGNRPEDIDWDNFHEWIDEIAEVYDIYSADDFMDIILEALKEKGE